MEEDENEHPVNSPFSIGDGRQRDSGFSESITGTEQLLQSTCIMLVLYICTKGNWTQKYKIKHDHATCNCQV